MTILTDHDKCEIKQNNIFNKKQHNKNMFSSAGNKSKINNISLKDTINIYLKNNIQMFCFVARHIQQIYRMEPAGSMGVWNLGKTTTKTII